jgi:hypothetical protein
MTNLSSQTLFSKWTFKVIFTRKAIQNHILKSHSRKKTWTKHGLDLRIHADSRRLKIRMIFRKTQNWTWLKYSNSALLIYFEIDCFYGLWTRIYEYSPPSPNYRAGGATVKVHTDRTRFGNATRIFNFQWHITSIFFYVFQIFGTAI